MDRLQLGSSVSAGSSPVLQATEQYDTKQDIPRASLDKFVQLQAVIKALSTTTSSQALLQPTTLRYLIEGFHKRSGQSQDPYEQELEWLFVSKASAQVYGLILDAFLKQTIPLSDEIWYWDTVLGSHRYTSLYTLQLAPTRFWGWSKSIYGEVGDRLESIRTSEIGVQQAQDSLTARWKQYYGLVRQTIRDRSVANLQSKIMSPLTRSRIEVRQKQRYLRRLREMGASGLGVLMDEALRFEADDTSSEASKNGNQPSDEWKSIVSKSVALMETVLLNVTTLETGVTEFEDLVFSHIENDPEDAEHTSPARPAILAGKLHRILTEHMPNYENTSNHLVRKHGRPSKLTRYWIPAAVLLFSSSTLLRLFFKHKLEILDWVRGIGATTKDFWYNWVVEPLKKVIGTIRHDKDSEIAIMSKESLAGDRDSLERMVTDFARDHPNDTGLGRGLTEAELNEVRAKVREGDLTPVLRAYERDLRKPFMGTVRGDLIRALLIQVQKTKVDVEVALGGIDALLKSQELVFGFVGLTPGILVCLGVSRWLLSNFGGRQGRLQGKGKSRIVRVLR